MARIVTDLHMHSKFARAVSRDMVPERLGEWAAKKGVNVVATGDMTHPAWFAELREKLEPAEPGLFKLKRSATPEAATTRFLLSGEISCIYSKNGKVRRVHHLIYAPSFETAEAINTALQWFGKLKSDGRPIIGMDSKKLLQILLDASNESYLIPAHAWTPWFGIFGSKSGFDSLEECFEELSSRVFAIETGLSSDPPMNWRIPFLDDRAIISGSDAHSLPKIGREATVLELEKVSYGEIFSAIRSRDPKRFAFTIEFFPEEGKYHYDGHRDASHFQSPDVTKRLGGKCEKCGRAVTVGVMARIDDLASPERPAGFNDASRIPYKKLVPLGEIIINALGSAGETKAGKKIYDDLIRAERSEIDILLSMPISDISLISANSRVAEGVERVRAGRLIITPGYDGEFGVVRIFSDEDGGAAGKPQTTLF